MDKKILGEVMAEVKATPLDYYETLSIMMHTYMQFVHLPTEAIPVFVDFAWMVVIFDRAYQRGHQQNTTQAVSTNN